MLSILFRQLTASCGVVFRTVRAFFSRQIYAVVARVKSATSLTRQASKLAPAMLKVATDAGKKPSKREDYIETKQLFISKSLLIMIPLILVAVAALTYFFVWPWMMSHFFTARMWCDDTKTANYTGKVILYYEKGKKTAKLEGRLEEGLLQGAGRSFDENGLLLYSGDYVDGLYSGKGSLYEAGELIYQGEFSDGMRSGAGTAYQDGKRCYKGDFSDDLYNGEGILYDTDGNVRYRGSFLDGLYSGTGTMTLDNGGTMQAEFENGVVIGDAKCFLNGKLYYEGAMEQFMPGGTGTLYAANGDKLYFGPMKNGIIDCGALLGISAADLREMLLGDITERSYEQGFSITSAELGLTVVCSYAQQDADPTVYHVFLHDPGKGHTTGALMWDTAKKFETYTRTDDKPPKKMRGGILSPALTIELPVKLGAEPYCQPYLYDGYTLNLWSIKEGDEPLLLEWKLGEGIPAASDLPAFSISAQQLDTMLGQPSITENQNDTDEELMPQRIGKNAQEIFQAAAARKENVYSVLAMMLNYLENKEQCAAAQESILLYQTLADEESALVDKGKGNAQQLSALEDAVAKLEVQIAKYTVQMRKEARNIKSATGLNVAEYDLSGLLVLFDADQLDADMPQMYKAALSAMKAADKSEEANKLKQELEDSVLELELAYQDVLLAQKEYESAAANADKLNRKYTVGEAAKAELFNAQIDINSKRVPLYAAMTDFSKKAALLDEQTGGWISQKYGWLTDILVK